MCGIVGWIDWDRDLGQHAATLDAMTAKLAPRGPDASGVWITRHAALGHRRLIVIDPAGGAQPMVKSCGKPRYALVYNGELYNTPEVRVELEKRGYAFSTSSDTEAVLLAFVEWGAQCVEKLNGIFAFAVWDEANECLFLARDRAGVKPLFFSQRGSAFLFASELKSLLAHPLVRPDVGADGLCEIFFIGPTRTPGHAVYRDISELRAGWCLTHDRNGTRLRRYWSLASRRHPDDMDQTVETVRTLVLDAVKRQLVSDVPVGTLLSGGLDSSAISAIAARVLATEGRGPLRTWSVDHKDNADCFIASRFQPDADAPWVKRMVEFLGTKHHCVVLDTPELVEALKTALAARDLPGLVDVDAALYLLCVQIKKHVTVVLSGECADEIFGGYAWLHDPSISSANTFPWLRGERARLLEPWLCRRLNADDYVRTRYRQALAEVSHLDDESPAQARHKELMYLHQTWFMANLLDRKDRMGMATGLEVRVPFADHRLMDYAWNIPPEWKAADGREKGILRRALKDILPDDVLARKKAAFPKTHSPAYHRAVRAWLRGILADRASPLRPLLNPAAVAELVEQDEDPGSLPWYGNLMKRPQLLGYLCQVDTWLRNYRVNLVLS